MPTTSLLIALSVILIPACAYGQDVRYRLEPVVRDQLIELHVTMTFHGSSTGRTTIALPRDDFGVPGMYRFVSNVVPPSNTSFRRTDDSTLVFTHGPNARLTFSYDVRFDSLTAGFIAFGPSVDASHYHFLGSQWMARAGTRDSVQEYAIEIASGDVSGAPLGSFGIEAGEHRVRTSFDRLIWTVVAGGSYRRDHFACEGRPVVTAIHGEFRLPADSIFALARVIACGQRDLWRDHSQPFYSIVVTPRTRLRAGASYLNAFACFIRPDSRADQIALLLAHEMMHAWIPRKLRLVPGAGEMPTVEFSTFHNVRYDWFHEGFTEYLARILLVRIGLVPQDWFGEQLNQELARLAMHPYRTISTDELEEAVRRKRFTNFHQRISYHRGFVVAFNLDAAVRRVSPDSSSLVDVIRRLLTLASDSGTLTRDDLVAAFRERGVDASGIVEKQALRGMPMLPDSTGLGPEWVLRFRERAAFDAGFDVVTSITNSMAIGVEQGGAAHAAGLREGMRIERVVNGMPWSEDWNPDLPTTVVVREGLRERTISFLARAGTTQVPYFEKRR